MTQNRLGRFFKYSPTRILLPMAIMTLLFAGTVFLYLLPSMEDRLMQSKQTRIADMTRTLVASLNRLNAEAEQGHMSMDQARAMGRKLVREMRYGANDTGYFWVNDMRPYMIVHPYRPDLEGKDISDIDDPTGKQLFRSFVETVQDQGSGFVEYHWQWLDQADSVSRKFSHVRLFKPWDWIVGTGFYMSDVKQEMATYRNRFTTIFLAILLAIAALEYYLLRQVASTQRRREHVEKQRKKLIAALQAGEERYRTIADFGLDCEMWIGVEGEMKYCSPASQQVTGYPPEAFFENPALLRSLIIPEDQPAWDEYLTALQQETATQLDFRVITQSGAKQWLNVTGCTVFGAKKKPLGLRISLRDITGRKAMEERLRYQALHDPLTGLANRTLSADRIGQAMSRAMRRDNYYFAVIFLDLDRFKVINDSLGHPFGDMVLTETANRLLDGVRSLDTVSRFGGDEFVLLLDELSSPGQAIRIIKRLRKAMMEPFIFDGSQVQTTASFGIVLSPVGSLLPTDVLQHANIAMHQAKASGRNRFKVFTNKMLENAVHQLSLENDMRRGIDQNEFRLEYQPIIDVETGSIIGFEALLRWDHPTRGLVAPSDFIPLAEESGFILDLGEWVLATALQTLAHWRTTTPAAKDVFVSVNLSAKQFARVGLDKYVLDTLKHVGLPPSALKLEVTESVIMEHPRTAVRLMKLLRRAGVGFSIDDFGTGYSSLSQLQQLPVDTLKVDRSFISHMENNQENLEIVKAVVALGRTLDLQVIAEGVEKPTQVRSLLELDCPYIQGFFFHRPLTADAAFKLLQDKRSDI